MRYKKTRIFLLFWCLFVGLGAFYGGILMLVDPTGKLLGMNNLLPYFKVLPFSSILFQNYIFSGIALIIVNGISNLIASYLIIKNKKSGLILGTVFGFTLMLWITIQFIIFPLNILSISYFIIGILQLLTGYMAYVFYSQEHFEFDLKKYSNIGKNNDVLVVYFSRMGYTRKIAYEYANKTGAYIKEIKTNEKTDGTLGFWWCGRFGMHKWRMPINDIPDIKKYKSVVIVSPIWVFSICSPVREFCYKYAKDLNRVSYIFTHFMKSNFDNVSEEVDKITKKKRDKFISVCIRFGKVKNYTIK